MLMSSALFRQASYDDVVEWIWSLGDISSGGMLQTTAEQHNSMLHSGQQYRYCHNPCALQHCYVAMCLIVHISIDTVYVQDETSIPAFGLRQASYETIQWHLCSLKHVLIVSCSMYTS